MKKALILAACFSFALFGCDSKAAYSKCSMNEFQDAEKVTIKDTANRFSLKVPKGWKVKKDESEGASKIVIKAACETTIIISSRMLDHEEKKLNPDELLSAMLLSYLDSAEKNGNRVINYGKYPSFKDGYPSFTVVLKVKDRAYPGIFIGSATDDKNLSIIAIRKDTFDSDAPADILKMTIETIKML